MTLVSRCFKYLIQMIVFDAERHEHAPRALSSDR